MVIRKFVDLFEMKSFVSYHFCHVSYHLAGKWSIILDSTLPDADLERKAYGGFLKLRKTALQWSICQATYKATL